MEMSDMLHIPIRINEEYGITKDIIDSEWTPENQWLFKAKKKMTLRDVIGGVFWEISFYGGPKDKKDEKEKLEHRVDEFNKAKEVTGEGTTYGSGTSDARRH